MASSAAKLVRSGTVFPLNWRIDYPDPPLLGRAQLRHVTKDLGPGTDDYYDNFYPQASSQWDALKHVGHPQFGYYNGLPLENPSELGVSQLGVDRWAARGIVGRFVLVDIARHRASTGQPLPQDEGIAITVEELDETLEQQNVHLSAGDILLLRFGWISWYERLGRARRELLGSLDMFSAPGLSPRERSAEWLWDHDVAAVAADNPALEVMPFDKASIGGFLHYRLIALLGFAVGELFALDALAEACAATQTYEGLLASAPLNMPGGAGSPANALAIL
jgi:kynurenine formamidase